MLTQFVVRLQQGQVAGGEWLSLKLDVTQRMPDVEWRAFVSAQVLVVFEIINLWLLGGPWVED